MNIPAKDADPAAGCANGCVVKVAVGLNVIPGLVAAALKGNLGWSKQGGDSSQIQGFPLMGILEQ